MGKPCLRSIRGDSALSCHLTRAHLVIALLSMVLSLRGNGGKKTVICNISESIRRRYDPRLPIVGASPGDVYKKIKMLIENPLLRC